jgi:adenosylmethionine-8-amino-7-oxononanoate aminotransferase
MYGIKCFYSLSKEKYMDLFMKTDTFAVIKSTAELIEIENTNILQELENNISFMKSLASRDQNVIWHPFTQMKTAAPPIAIVKGKGAKLWDDQGRVYIDAISSWWMNTHGHAHPKIAEALKKQADTLEHVIFADFTHEPAVELSERLLGHLPENQARVFFSDNGSTAIEIGLKMCFQYWYNLGKTERSKIIAFEGAYHGDTFGAMSVGGRSAFTAPYAPYLFDVLFVEPPVPGREQAALDRMAELLEEHKGEIAGFIFEPLVQGAGGMLMHEAEALDAILDLCKAEGVLAIADEVMVGFGRTGKMFATEKLRNTPDIYALSKGLTGGTMAFAVTTCTEEVFNAFLSEDKLKMLFHGHSCTGNPLACAVALASLDLMEEEETWGNIRRIESRHRQFAKTIKGHPFVKNLRQQGVILAFDVRNDSETSYFNELRDYIWEFFLNRQLLLRPLGNTVYILPPYCITDEELDVIYDAIAELLSSLDDA